MMPQARSGVIAIGAGGGYIHSDQNYQSPYADANAPQNPLLKNGPYNLRELCEQRVPTVLREVRALLNLLPRRYNSTPSTPCVGRAVRWRDFAPICYHNKTLPRN